MVFITVYSDTKAFCLLFVPVLKKVKYTSTVLCTITKKFDDSILANNSQIRK